MPEADHTPSDAPEQRGPDPSAGAFLLTWNPAHWAWPELPELIGQLRDGQAAVKRWSTGNSKSIREGARAYLYRQGSDGRGLVGAGRVVRGSYEADHWNDARGGTANYVDVAFETLLDPREDVLLPPEVLDREPLRGVHWGTQTSGIGLDAGVSRHLDALLTGWVAALRTDGDGFIDVMGAFAEEGLVFSSSVRDALYAVSGVDDRGADVARLSASEPARATASGYVRAVRRVMQNGGHFPAVQLDGTAALRAAYSQGPGLGLGPSGDVVALVTPGDAADLLVSHLDALRVDRSGGAPKPYQPALLACVLEAVEAGELTENRVPYDWLEPRFLAFLRERGTEVTPTEAAYGFFYLSRKPFWLLGYRSPSAEAVAALDPPSPAKLGRAVTHGRLGWPYWAALQDPALRSRVREALEPWWEGGGGGVLDRELLGQAVDQTIRPAIVGEGRLAEGEPEGYQHHTVLTTTVPLLTPESIEEDPLGAVGEALKAHVNLLSQFELMYALTLFAETPDGADGVREHLLDLLYGEDRLAERVDRFTAWAEMEDREDGAGRRVNATTASYLLAASQPGRYAFCKPSVYTPAARALLGEAVGPSTPGERVAAATELYREALALFRDEHGLPFDDLMHVHIAFYVVKQDDRFPGWKELQEGGFDDELAEPLSSVFEGRSEAEWAFDLLRETLGHLGVVGPGDPRVVLSLPRNYGGRVLRLNFGQWVVLDFRGDPDGPTRMAVTLLSEDGRAIEGAEQTGEPFAPAPGRPEQALFMFAVGDVRPMPDALAEAIAASMAEVANRFEGWSGSPYVHHHQRQIEGAVFDEDEREELFDDGFAPTPEPPPETPYTLADCAEETGIAEAELARWVRAIERKRQAVFYGPPGTGKTFLVERLARHLVGGADGLVETVQFHPAYSYEDFVEGIRPRAEDGQLRYPLVPGRLLRFCAEAERRGGRCVLVIDEINRANLSRVFGELMYLLEYRDRTVTLASGRPFSIPKNVRVLGTMNTADRSIALVDHALRRRFAFVRLGPDFDVLRRYHRSRGTGFPVDALVRVLERLNEQIGDAHYAVGISYFLDEALGNGIEDVWRMEIEPYLEEYFFDRPESAEPFQWAEVERALYPEEG